MKDYYEGSVSTIGDSEWTEPHSVSAVTAEIAAIEVLKSHAEVHEVAIQQYMDVCVRQVDLDGDPLGEWQYFRGKAWIVYRAEAHELSPENAKDQATAGSVPLDQLIKLLKKHQRYPIGIANCLSNDTRYVRDDIVDLNAVRAAIQDGSILDLRNFGKKRAAELAELLGMPWPKRRKEVCLHCGRPMPAQND